MSQFDGPSLKKRQTMEAPQIEDSILKYRVPPFWPTYSAWHLKATPNVKLKYSSHTTCNPKNLVYLCSTSHDEQSYATYLSKSFFLVEIMLVEIDDFHPNLAEATHIWPQGFIGSLRVRAK
jgi:hypothetical protein